jgi:cell shape-determining protein MreC
MARVAPNSGSKAIYLLCILAGAILLYLDIAYKSFDSIKNTYISTTISSTYLLKKITVDPFIYLYDLSSSKSHLVNENKNLQAALDKSYLENFIVSRGDKFFMDDEAITALMSKYEIDEVFHASKIKFFDTTKYFCCDTHIMYIEVISSSGIDFTGSAVINSEGIIGQVISDNGVKEVLLLTDTSHYIPLETEGYFCNAKGSGKPGIISCRYSSLIWTNPVSNGQKLYSSGLGGIYPRGILIGYVQEITNIDETDIKIDISLITDPIKNSMLGIIEN